MMLVRSKAGQVMPMALALVIVTAGLWLMILNIGKLIKDRIQVQMAADTAAHTAAAIRARGLNIVGTLNAVLGIPGLTLGEPQAAWWPSIPHPPGRQLLTQSIDDIKSLAESAKRVYQSGWEARVINTLLKSAIRPLFAMIRVTYDIHRETAGYQRNFVHGIQTLQRGFIQAYGGGLAYQKALEVAQLQGTEGIFTPPGSFSLGLVRNYGMVRYLYTVHLWTPWNPTIPIPLPLPDGIEDDGPTSIRWYEQSPHFYMKTQRVYVYHRPQKNSVFPLGRRLFGIGQNNVLAVSAARLFNEGGPMFPSGRNYPVLAPGLKAATDYGKASGWRAQLVPVGPLYEH